MASVTDDTAEGSGEICIETWLKENKLSSLLRNQKFTEYIDEQEATLQDILDLNEEQLNALCEECGLRVLERNKFLKMVKKSQSNDVNKKHESNTSKTIIIIRSEAEQIAIDNVEKQQTILKNTIVNINGSIGNTKNSAKNYENIIDKEFNKMNDMLNKRKTELKKQLKNIENKKLNIYNDNLDKVTNISNNISKLQSEWNHMLYDTNINQKERQNKIKSQSVDILKKSTNVLKNDIVNSVNDTFNVKFNSAQNYTYIGNIGTIDGNEVVPEVSVINVSLYNVDINIELKVNDDILLYGLQCQEIKENDDEKKENENEKKENKSCSYLEFKNNKYTIKNLKSERNYFVKVKAKISQNVWTDYSVLKYFKTLPLSSFDSVILTDTNGIATFTSLVQPQLRSILNKKEVSLKLIYRNSRDGNSPQAFHSKCNGHLNTLILVRSNFGHIFGGFTTLDWNSSKGTYKKDDSAFLYLICSAFGHPSKIYSNIKKNGYAIYTDNTHGPAFGSGHNLVIHQGSRNNRCYTTPAYTYSDIIGNALGGGKTLTTSGGQHVFTLDEYEVFVVS